MTAEVGLTFRGQAEGAVAASRKVGEEIKKSGASARTAGIDFGKAEQDISRSGRGALAASGAFSHLGRSIAFASSAFIGAAGFTSVMRASIGAAADLQQQIGRTTAVFGPAAAGVRAFAKTAADSIGQSQGEALKMVATLGTMFQTFGVGAKESAGMSQQLVKVAADLHALGAGDTVQIFDALRTGLGGNSRALKQFGIDITSAQVKAEALTSGLVKANVNLGKVKDSQLGVSIATEKLSAAIAAHGKNSVQAAEAQKSLDSANRLLDKTMSGSTVTLTSQQKALATYNLILADTKKAHGAFASSANNSATAMDKMHAHIKNVEEEIGTALLPYVTRAAKAIGEYLKTLEEGGSRHAAFVKVMREIVSAGKEIVGVLKGVAVIVGDFTKAVGGAKNMVVLLLAVLVARKFMEIGSAVEGMGTSFIKSGRNIATANLSAAGSSKSMAVAYGESISTMKAATLAFRDTLSAVVKTTIIGLLVTAIVLAATYVITHWNKVKAWLMEFWGWMKTAFRDAVDFIKGVFYGWIATEILLLKALADAAAKALGWIPGIGGKLKAAAHEIDGWYTDFKNKSLAAFADMGTSTAKAYADAYVTGMSAQQARMIAANAGGTYTSVGTGAQQSPQRAGRSAPSARNQGSLTSQQVYDLLIAQGATPDEAAYLTTISGRENASRNPQTINDSLKTHDYSVGLFQINFRDMQNKWMRGGQPAAARLANDPAAQARYALSLLHSQGPSAWSTSDAAAEALLHGQDGTSGAGGTWTPDALTSGKATKVKGIASKSAVSGMRAALRADITEATVETNAGMGGLITGLKARLKELLAAVRDGMKTTDLTMIRQKASAIKAQLTEAFQISDLRKAMGQSLDEAKAITDDGYGSLIAGISKHLEKLRSELKMGLPQAQRAVIVRQYSDLKAELARAASLEEVSTKLHDDLAEVANVSVAGADTWKVKMTAALERLRAELRKGVIDQATKDSIVRKLKTDEAELARVMQLDDLYKTTQTALAAMNDLWKQAFPGTGDTVDTVKQNIGLIREQITALSAEIAADLAKHPTPADIGALKTKLALWTQAWQDQQTELQRLIGKQQTSLGNSLTTVTDLANQAFDRMVQHHIDEINEKYDKLAIDIQKKGAELTPAEQQISDLTEAHNAAARAKNAADAQVRYASAVQALNDATSQTGPNAPTATDIESLKQSVADAQQAIQDANYEATIAGLEKTATAERKVRDQQTTDAITANDKARKKEIQQYQDLEDAAKRSFDGTLASLEEMLANGTIDWDTFSQKVKELMVANGLDPKFWADSGTTIGTTIGANFLAEWEKAIAQAKADWDALVKTVGSNPLGGGSITPGGGTDWPWPKNPDGTPWQPGQPIPGATPTTPGAATTPTFDPINDPVNPGRIRRFKRGGIVPGTYVGRDDTVLAALTPGERVLSRDDVASGAAGRTYVFNNPTFLGTSSRDVMRELARQTKPEQDRIVGFTKV